MNVPISQYESTTITVVPISGGLGAEICGVDLPRKIDASTFFRVYQAWLQYSVLLFRGQHLTDDDLITFSKNFGELDWAPVQVLSSSYHHILFFSMIAFLYSRSIRSF